MCGIFGIYAKNYNIKRLTYFGLKALQHRGQESVGMLSYRNDETLYLKRGIGLVDDIFEEADLKDEEDYLCIGHVRYSTKGGQIINNVQPFYIKTPIGYISLVHNGNLTNYNEVKEKLAKWGLEPKGTTDSELILLLIARYIANNDKELTIGSLDFITSICKGAYSLIIGTPTGLIAYRDKYGFRPLVVGTIDTHWIIASESCAITNIGGHYQYEVTPGEAILLTHSSIYRWQYQEPIEKKCIFESIYFSRPDSIDYNTDESIYNYRVQLGRSLAKEYPVDADIVIGTPDSGIPASIGYSEESGIKYGYGLVRNKYTGRTFIKPTQEMRELSVGVKLSVILDQIKGQRVIIVDDSIVRGFTIQRIIERLYNVGGAAEVHVRISSPPIVGTCHYGIDTSKKEELIALRSHSQCSGSTELPASSADSFHSSECNTTHKFVERSTPLSKADHKSIEEIRRDIGATSLAFLSLDKLFPKRDKTTYCRACFDLIYPVKPYE